MNSLTAGFVMENTRDHPTAQSVILRCAFAMCCTFLCAETHGQDTPDIKERFLNEAPQAWEKFEGHAKRLQGSFSFKAVLPSGEVIAHYQSEIKQKHGFALFLEQSLLKQDSHGQASLWAVNPHYGFELYKADQKKEWTVPQIALESVKPRPFDSLIQKVEMWCNAPITFFTISGLVPAEKKGAWLTIIKDPGFSVKAAVVQRQNGNQWCKVEFEYRPNGKSPRVPSIVTGWALLDPERHWCIQEYDIEFEWANQIGVKVAYGATYQYEESRDGFPVLKRIEINYSIPQQSYKSHYSYEFDLREADASVEDFTLSGYGFPEPVGITWPKPTRWWLWISVIAAGLLGIGLVSWKVKRRLRRPEPTAATTGTNEGGS